MFGLYKWRSRIYLHPPDKMNDLFFKEANNVFLI